MEFDFSETQRVMQQAAKAFLSKQCPPERVRELMATPTAMDDALWRGIVEQGWTAITIPETAMGLGLGAIELVAVAEEMGRWCLPGPLWSTIWAAKILEQVDSSDALATLANIASGEVRATVACFESAAGWDASAAATTAKDDGGDVVLTGTKSMVTDAAWAELLLVTARRGEETIVAAVYPNDEGVEVIGTPGIDATRPVSRVTLSNVRVPQERIVTSGEAADSALAAGEALANVALCGELVGGMQWVLDTTTDYARTRKQFDQQIGSFQAVQHMCADMLMYLEGARSATYFAAWSLAEGEPGAAAAVAIAKSYTADAAREVGNRGIQVHGGIGFTWEHDLQLYYKRATQSAVLLGDATAHRERLARFVIDEAA